MTKKHHENYHITLSIDIGGTELKASLFSASGKRIGTPVYKPTPYPCTPSVMVKSLVQLSALLGSFDRVSVGFPGVVRNNCIITAPHFKNKAWYHYPLAQKLEQVWNTPVRCVNDADMQGFAIVKGNGLELVVTLGTGIGTALFRDGELMPRLELAQHPVYFAKTYNNYIGDKVLKRIGKKKWNIRVQQALVWLNTLLNYDTCYISGGNVRHITIKLDRNVHKVPPESGLSGGVSLWKTEL